MWASHSHERVGYHSMDLLDITSNIYMYTVLLNAYRWYSRIHTDIPKNIKMDEVASAHMHELKCVYTKILQMYFVLTCVCILDINSAVTLSVCTALEGLDAQTHYCRETHATYCNYEDNVYDCHLWKRLSVMCT